MQPASELRDSRLVSDRGHDDTVLPFAVAPLDLRGRLVRLGPAIDHILSRHDYPSTVEDHELVDPTLSGERLLYRLFHERGVRVFQSQPIQDVCRCSTERVASMLRQFTPQERADMVGDNGKIGVTCEFCSTHREFDPAEFD
jgi:redox-regulated HSP33 family molecular chaperone